jgi:nitroreductase
MKKNYQPWSVKISDFYQQSTEIDKIKFLVNFGVLAPSSHNSQPWRFEIAENEIKVFLETSRRLPNSDKNDRQSYISLGCAITNILIAADYYGFDCNVEYYLENDEFLVAIIKITKKPQTLSAPADHLIFSVPNRLTNRNPYKDKLLSNAFFEEIQKYTDNDLEIHIIKDKDKKDKLADIALAASIYAMEDKNFRYELSQYVKSNITSSPIGMPCFGMGIPTLVSFIVPTMIKYFNMNKLSRKKDEALLKKHTPVFVIIATRQDDKLHWIKTGQVYEKIALLATREGLSTAMWAAPIQINEFYKEFQKILNTNFRPQAFFRLGFPTKQTPHSPRLDTQEVLKR